MKKGFKNRRKKLNIATAAVPETVSLLFLESDLYKLVIYYLNYNIQLFATD